MQRRTVLLIRSPEIGWTDLRTVVETEVEIVVVGEATTAREAIELAAMRQPDLIIAAAALEGTSTLPLLVDLHRRVCPTSKIVVLAAHLDANDFPELAEAIFDGYLLWSDLSREALWRCLGVVLADDVVVGSRTVAQTFIEMQCRPKEPIPVSVHLTTRERAILRHLAEGRTRQEIAATEGLSPRTVERTVSDLETKLDAPTAFVLGMQAAQFGLVP
ncbi:MAG: LuxR C-terminal-related transcriptional regulator [Thermomicrobiales bacterium]